VIGGKEELKSKAIEGWEKFDGHSPHRPWIDLVKTKCAKCGGKASRIHDVGNPWLDAGIVPYSTMKYNSDKDYWQKWFPADFITECFPGQFRNWFYALLAMSTMMENKAPFKTLLGHALVRDEKGEEMHKSKGNSIPFDEAAEKMGADLMRWMFCRANPVNNINFGYKIADDVRNKFTLKLWNTYSFFCNYARLDGFDPNAAEVPVSERPDIDRWILSDLQLLVKSARDGFESYNPATFCFEAERFVDDKLSNWYVRRNRRRFWKSESGKDKLAAYQTLYTVLTTLTRLIAPVMPFLAENLFQNLVVKGAGKGSSVHHEAYPEVNASLIDEKLSADMAALLKIVTMGSAIRNNVKIKVRQPVAELKIIAGDDAERSAVQRFADQITEELNIKKATLHDPSHGKLIDYKVKPNFKTLGPKMGTRMKEAQAALAALDPADLAAKANGSASFPVVIAGETFTLDPADLVVEIISPEGFASLADRATVVSLDTRLTPALKDEGLAREVVRGVQNLRKTVNLELDDRIRLALISDDADLRRAVETHKAYIMAETLAVEWNLNSLGASASGEDMKIEQAALRVEIQKS
jgi:isoleucyl-tRNA synthetase